MNNGSWGFDSKSQTLGAKPDRSHQPKNLHREEIFNNRGRKHPIEWKKIFAYPISSTSKRLTFNILRNSRKSTLRGKAHVFLNKPII